jgi:hypothetical protein
MLALTRFETRVAFANNENFATAANDFAVTMTGLSRFKRIQNFHDIPGAFYTARKYSLPAG